MSMHNRLVREVSKFLLKSFFPHRVHENTDMAEDTEISEQFKERLTAVAGTEQGQLPDDDNLKESTANPEGAGAASPTHSQGESSNRESPDPSCSICLGKLKNKSFTDSCCHTFCFACLLEWSKVKAVCPLCKVRFKSIVHNVRSNDDYDQYYIGRTPSHMPWPVPETRRFRYATTMPLLGRDRSHHISFLEVEEHRYTYAPHSVRSFPISHERNHQEPRNIQFRRRVYSENLWAKPTMLRSRCASPAFYQANQACTHRLVPWLTRELIVLLNSEQRVGFILDFMMSLILRYSILSEEFFLHIEPYLGNNTLHFVHEFYSFATSIFEIEQYDEAMQYESHNQTLASTETDVIAVESGDSEDYPLDMSVSPTTQPSYSSSLSSGLSAVQKYESTRQRKRKPLTKLFLKKNHENNLWNVLLPPPPPVSPAPSPPSFPEDLTLPSSSRAFGDVSASTSRSFVTFSSARPVITLSSEDDESDCLIVHEVKPRWMRTPEVIQIASSPEPEVERALTPPLPDLEPVSDGSLDVIEDGDDSDNNPFVLDGSSPVVINVPDSSQALSTFNADELTVDYVMPCERQSRKSSSNKRDRHVPMWSRERARWSSSSSSRSRESKFRSWSPDRENVLHEFFGDNRRSLIIDCPGLRFSETSELGESSRKVRMPDTDWDDRYSSSSDSDTMKRNKLRSVVKKSCHRNPSDSSNRSFRSKKSKSKRKKKKKSDKHKRHKH